MRPRKFLFFFALRAPPEVLFAAGQLPTPPPSAYVPAWTGRTRIYGRAQEGHSEFESPGSCAEDFDAHAQHERKLGRRIGEADRRGPDWDPRRRARSAHAAVARRSDQDIRGPRASKLEQEKRALAVADWLAWLDEAGISERQVWTFDGDTIATLLGEFGQSVFRRGASVIALKNAILGVGNRRSGLRPFLRSAWTVVSNWEREEPGGSHVPVPRVAFGAAISVSVCWRWSEMTAALVTGWVGLARPGEHMRLRRRDLLLPADLGEDRALSFIVYRDPTGRWGRNAAREEHVRVDDEQALAFLTRYTEGMADDDLLFPTLAIGDRYRKAWDAVFGSLGFRCRDGDGLTLASLRAGAGTAVYVATADVVRFQWLARHQNIETGRRYIQ